ncbi:hypothetical protein L9F63_002877, partial [Diploptera punctata]
DLTIERILRFFNRDQIETRSPVTLSPPGCRTQSLAKCRGTTNLKTTANSPEIFYKIIIVTPASIQLVRHGGPGSIPDELGDLKRPPKGLNLSSVSYCFR